MTSEKPKEVLIVAKFPSEQPDDQPTYMMIPGITNCPDCSELNAKIIKAMHDLATGAINLDPPRKPR